MAQVKVQMQTLPDAQAAGEGQKTVRNGSHKLHTKPGPSDTVQGRLIRHLLGGQQNANTAVTCQDKEAEAAAGSRKREGGGVHVMDLEGAFRGAPQGTLHQDGCACGGQNLQPTHLGCHLCAYKHLHAASLIA